MVSALQVVLLLLLNQIVSGMARGNTLTEQGSESTTDSESLPQSLSLGIGATAAVIASSVVLVITLLVLRLVILANAIHKAKQGKRQVDMDSMEENVAYTTVSQQTGDEKQHGEPTIYATIPEPAQGRPNDPSPIKLSPLRGPIPPAPETATAETNMNEMDGDNLYDYIDENSTFKQATRTSFLEVSTNASYGMTALNVQKQDESHIYDMDEEIDEQPPPVTQTSTAPIIPPRRDTIPASEVAASAMAGSLVVKNTPELNQEEDDYIAMDGSA